MPDQNTDALEARRDELRKRWAEAVRQMDEINKTSDEGDAVEPSAQGLNYQLIVDDQNKISEALGAVVLLLNPQYLRGIASVQTIRRITQDRYFDDRYVRGSGSGSMLRRVRNCIGHLDGFRCGLGIDDAASSEMIRQVAAKISYGEPFGAFDTEVIEEELRELADGLVMRVEGIIPQREPDEFDERTVYIVKRLNPGDERTVAAIVDFQPWTGQVRPRYELPRYYRNAAARNLYDGSLDSLKPLYWTGSPDDRSDQILSDPLSVNDRATFEDYLATYLVRRKMTPETELAVDLLVHAGFELKHAARFLDASSDVLAEGKPLPVSPISILADELRSRLETGYTVGISKAKLMIWMNACSDTFQRQPGKAVEQTQLAPQLRLADAEVSFNPL